MHLEVQQESYPPGMREEMERFVAGENAQPAGTLLSQLYWLPRWLPIAGDGGGGGLFIDLRDGPLHGCLVEFSREHQGTTPRWESVTQLWVDVADELEAVDSDLLRSDRVDDLRIDWWRPPPPEREPAVGGLTTHDLPLTTRHGWQPPSKGGGARSYRGQRVGMWSEFMSSGRRAWRG